MTKRDEFMRALHELETCAMRHAREDVSTCYGTLVRVEHARTTVLALYDAAACDVEALREVAEEMFMTWEDDKRARILAALPKETKTPKSTLAPYPSELIEERDDYEPWKTKT